MKIANSRGGSSIHLSQNRRWHGFNWIRLDLALKSCWGSPGHTSWPGVCTSQQIVCGSHHTCWEPYMTVWHGTAGCIIWRCPVEKIVLLEAHLDWRFHMTRCNYGVFGIETELVNASNFLSQRQDISCRTRLPTPLKAPCMTAWILTRAGFRGILRKRIWFRFRFRVRFWFHVFLIFSCPRLRNRLMLRSCDVSNKWIQITALSP